jgi:hypothetical protein
MDNQVGRKERFFRKVNVLSGKNAQQSVQPTDGIRPDLQAFFWLRAFSAPKPNPRPPTSG